MNNQLQEEIKQALETDQTIAENIIDEQDSPLNQPVKEKDIAGNQIDDFSATSEESESSEQQSTADFDPFSIPQEEPLDAPEQEFSADPGEVDPTENQSNDNFEIPNEQAAMMADTVLGMTDNFLAIGGGFFVKIKKHRSFLDFDQVVQVIDEQNQKNIQRIQLDEIDKLLLKPLLMQVLKKRAKSLSVEQQLLGAVLSILMKKVQVIMQIRSEMKMLEDKILESIKASTAAKNEAAKDDEEESEVKTAA